MAVFTIFALTSNRGPGKAFRIAKGLGTTGTGVMLRTAHAIVAAAIVSAAFIAFLSLSMNLEAKAHAPGLKGDRADTRPLAANCSQHAWPYFEASCLRDPSKPFGETRDVRLISTDRIALAAGK